MGPFGDLRVFLLDDHDIVRRGLSDMMSAKRDITVVGDTGSAARAVAMILELEPDVMVLDVHLQDGTGVQVCREVRAVKPQIMGLILTAAADDDARALALLAGAAGFATKLARSFEIIDVVRQVGSGERLVGPDAAPAAEERLRRALDAATPPTSFRERKLLPLLLAGLSDDEVAERLAITPAEATAEAAALVDRIRHAVT